MRNINQSSTNNIANTVAMIFIIIGFLCLCMAILFFNRTLLIIFGCLFIFVGIAIHLLRNWRKTIKNYAFKIAFVLGLLGFFLILLGVLYYLGIVIIQDRGLSDIFVTIGFGIIAVGIAIVSYRLAFDSDRKMVSLAELNFLEKIAMMYGYLSDIQENRITKNANFVMRIIKDLKAGFCVSKWINKTDNKDILKSYTTTFDKLRDYIDKELLNLLNDEQKEEYRKFCCKVNQLKDKLDK